MKTKLEQMSKEELIGEVMTLEIDKIFTEYVTNKKIKELEDKIQRFDEVDIAIIDSQGDW